jgi:very-short-patch-repair endonuclease
MKYQEILELSRKFRKNQTPAELMLWQELRNRKLDGWKFLRQHAIIYESAKNDFFFFIPDFYCSELKLAIELDGKIHDFHRERDYNRDMILIAKGISVLRINNDEINNIETAKEKIRVFILPLCSQRGRKEEGE